MRNDRFEWDDDKAASNRVDHRVTFEMASEVFDDPRALENHDDHPDEERFMTIGTVEGRLITVVWTERGPRIRIISAWSSTSRERRQYNEQPG